MKKVLTIVVICLGMMMAGCSTLVNSPDERNRRISQIWDVETRMLVDDWDAFWLVDHNTRTTRYHSRVGI